MNSPKIPARVFHRHDEAYRWKLWVKVLSRDNLLYYHFFWKRIGVFLAVLLGTGYLTATVGAWYNIVHRHGYYELGFADFILPWRWDQYRKVVDARYLRQGRQELEKGDPAAALNYFNPLLNFEPGNLENRRLAAQAQYQLGFKSVALDILRAGLTQAANAGDEAYLRAYFPIAFEEQADDEAFDLARRLLPAQPDGTAFHRFVALQAATARYNRRHDIEAEQILDSWKLRDTPEGEVLYAFCNAERGLRLPALVRLKQDLERFPKTDAIYLAIERLAREEGRPMEVRLFALLRVIDEPKDPQTRIDLLEADRTLNRKAELHKEIDLYCFDFKSDLHALALLAEFAAAGGDPDTAEQARDQAQAAGGADVEFDLAVAEAAIAAQDYPRALRAVARAQADSGGGNQDYETTFDGFKTVAQFGAQDSSAELAFTDFLPRAGALRPAVGLFLVQQLSRGGFTEPSRQLLERICSEHPDDQPALAELIRSDAAAHDRAGLVANLPQFLKMRKPPEDALEASLPCLDPVKDAALRAGVTDALGDIRSAPASPGT